MKKTTLLLSAGLVLFLSSRSFTTYSACTAYSGLNKAAQQGQTAQVKDANDNVRQHGVISSIL